MIDTQIETTTVFCTKCDKPIPDGELYYTWDGEDFSDEGEDYCQQCIANALRSY